MKKYFFSFLLLVIWRFSSYSQDSYKKRYYVKDTIIYFEYSYNTNKKVKHSAHYLNLESDIGVVDSRILKIAKNGKGLRSNVAFGEDEDNNKLYINPWLVSGSNGYVDRDSVYYYKLHNRQSVKIKFRQWSFNALTVPLKARFGKDQPEFSTGANLGALLGYSWGQTNFLHRKKIGNKTYDSKLTLGLFRGADELDFSFEEEGGNEIEISTAFLSTGIGFLYSYQKFTFGLTGGFDFALGENHSEWEFHGRPWAGLSLGYSLFAF